MDREDEDLLLLASVSGTIDPADQILMSACQRLSGMGYIDLHYEHESLTAENRLHCVRLSLTDEGAEEVVRITRERGG